MKVQVTKDAWGIAVWYDDIELTYSKLKNTPEMIARGDLTSRSSSVLRVPVWIPRKLYFFRRTKIFSNRFVKKNFADLGATMNEGDLREMEITIRMVQ